MKKIDLSWVLFLLLVLCIITCFKEEIIDKLNNLNIINYNKEIISYTYNSEYDYSMDNVLTGEEYDFDKEYYIYYSFLSLDEQKLYKQVYANALAYNKTFTTIVKLSTSDLNDTMEAFYSDHPELFYLDTTYQYKYNSKGECIELTLNYNDTINDIENNKILFNNEIDKIVNEANKYSLDFYKEKYVYITIINRVSYDTNAKNSQSAFGALMSGKSVCAGYAKLFQIIMRRLNIPTYYVLGYAKEDHAWNIVKINNEYYNLDITWDDTGYIYKHFNLTDKEMELTHKRTGISKYLPNCNYTTYSLN